MKNKGFPLIGTIVVTILIVGGIAYYFAGKMAPLSNLSTDSETSSVPIASSSTNLVINGISGPTTLIIGQNGTWTINASDSVSNNLSYGVTWGDEGKGGNYPPNYDVSLAGSKSPSFSHSYQNSFEYTIDFVAKDDKGNYARTSFPVNIKTSLASAITITSPIGGEIWRIGETHNITWNSVDVQNVYIYLVYFNSKGEEEESDPIATAPASQGNYAWTIKDQIYPDAGQILNPPGQNFKILINEIRGTAQASSGLFDIIQ
jgi:hypothetical protein